MRNFETILDFSLSACSETELVAVIERLRHDRSQDIIAHALSIRRKHAEKKEKKPKTVTIDGSKISFGRAKKPSTKEVIADAFKTLGLDMPEDIKAILERKRGKPKAKAKEAPKET